MFDDLVELNTSKPWYAEGSLEYMGHRLEITSTLEHRYILCRTALIKYGRKGKAALRSYLPKPKGWMAFAHSDPLEKIAQYAEERATQKILYGHAEAGSLAYEEASIDLIIASILARPGDIMPIDIIKQGFYGAATRSKSEAERAVLEIYVTPPIAQKLLTINDGKDIALKIIDLYWSDLMAKDRYQHLARIQALEKEKLNETQTQKLHSLKDAVLRELNQHPPTNLFNPLPNHIQGALDLVASMKPKKSRILDAAKSRVLSRGINSDRELYADSDRWKW